MPQHVSVVVVGAGLAGLTTATRLAGAGVDVVVFEAGAEPGGRIGTVPFPDGATAEVGAQEFWAGGSAFPLLAELGLPLLEEPGRSSAVLDGEFYPVSQIGEARLPGFDALADLVARYAARPAAAPHDATIRDLVRDVAGTGPAADWAKATLEIETSVDWNDLAAPDGIAELLPFFGGVGGQGQTCARVVGGNGRLIDALVRRLPDERLRRGTRVLGVRDAGRFLEVKVADADGGPDTVTADHVVLAVPFWATATLDLDLRSTLPVRHALSSLRAVGYVKLVGRVRRDRVGADSLAMFPVVTETSAGCVYLTDPGEGRELVLTVLVGGAAAARLLGRPDIAVRRHCLQVLENMSIRDRFGARVGLFDGLDAAVTESRVFGRASALTHWPARLGRSRFDPLAAMLRRPIGRLHFAGDSTECCHTDGAVTSALRVIDQILGTDTGIGRPA